jgi:ribulose-phosphate 3-epimerase
MENKVEIIPAILPKDFKGLEDKISLIQGLVKTAQVDICDGRFAPNMTWPYRKHDDSFDRIVREEQGLPGWEKLDYEFDLMVNNPVEVVDDWIKAGATRIIIHAESEAIEETIRKITNRVPIGLALNVETPINSIEPHKNSVQFIQCMGIDKVGFQGQEFDSKVLKKIEEIKSKYPNVIISVDGGVSLENAKQLITAGASRLVIGSAIFDSDNPIGALREFQRLA